MDDDHFPDCPYPSKKICLEAYFKNDQRQGRFYRQRT